MSKCKTISLWISSIFLIALIWIYRPYPGFDSTKVIPEIATLEKPFKTVVLQYWMDGGSVGITIVDVDGKELKACIPEPDHQRLYIGATHHWEKNTAKEIANPKDSISQLLTLIRTHDTFTHSNDLYLAAASGRVRDYFRVAYRSMTRQYSYPEQ